MIKIRLKSYNNNLLTLFFSYLKKSNYKNSVKSISFLPPRYKNFNIKKSPHVNGRSKENYSLKQFSGSCILNFMRKEDFKNFLLFISKLRLNGLGISITFR